MSPRVVLREFDHRHRIVLEMRISKQSMDLDVRLESLSSNLEDLWVEWNLQNFFVPEEMSVKICNGFTNWMLRDKLNIQNLCNLLRWAKRRANSAMYPKNSFCSDLWEVKKQPPAKRAYFLCYLLGEI